MVDAVVLKLNGEDVAWHFNNYALFELAKVLETTPDKAHQEVMSIAKDDVFMGLAVVVYAGIVGYEKSQFNLKHGVTIQSITQLMATVDTNEFTPMWEAFKNTMGITEFLETLPPVEGEKKKKSVGGKSSSSQPVKSV